MAIGQSQVGKVAGEAAATAEAAMTGKGNDQIGGAVGPRVAEVVKDAGAHGIAAGAAATARAGSRRPVAAAPLDAWLGEILDARDALGDIRDIFPWTGHGLNS